jgi:hypothetical protein
MRIVVAFLLTLASVHGLSFGSPSRVTLAKEAATCSKQSPLEAFQKACVQGLMIGCLAFPQIATAVSGGGLDYANMDITGEDFSNGQYKGKDFTQVRERSH